MKLILIKMHDKNANVCDNVCVFVCAIKRRKCVCVCVVGLILIVNPLAVTFMALTAALASLRSLPMGVKL